MRAIAILTALFLCGCGKATSHSKAAAGGSDAGAAASQGPSRAADANDVATFWGHSARAATVVYMLDRSGSMLHAFDDVRREVLASVAQLDANRQSFHVILFGDGSPQELCGADAPLATADRKKAAAEFLAGTWAAGETDPAPALTRAFDVLDSAPAGGKALFLLSDSGFPNNEEVLQICRFRNSARGVQVHAVVYPSQPNGTEPVAKKIAEDSGGQCRLVQAGE